jgi:hypothetical protein
VKSALQADLFEAENPRLIECSGGELLPLVAGLKARGCIVLGMAAICVNRWRLTLDWPKQNSLPGVGRLKMGQGGC